jgi:hypothetical protein
MKSFSERDIRIEEEMIDKLLNCTSNSDYIKSNDYDCTLKKEASCNPEED